MALKEDRTNSWSLVLCLLVGKECKLRQHVLLMNFTWGNSFAMVGTECMTRLDHTEFDRIRHASYHLHRSTKRGLFGEKGDIFI